MFSQSCQIQLQFCCVLLGSNYTNINFYFSDSYNIGVAVIKKEMKDFVGPHIISGKYKKDLNNKIMHYIWVSL